MMTEKQMRFALETERRVSDAVTGADAVVLAEAQGEGEHRCVFARGEHRAELYVRRSRARREVWTFFAARRGAPAELHVRPALMGEGIDRVLGLTLDDRTGDEGFDRRFVIESAPKTVARFLLGAELRAALRALPQSDEGPTMRVDPTHMMIRWVGAPEREALDAVVRAALACMERCTLLHEAIASSSELTPFRAASGGDAAVDPRSRAKDRARLAGARRRAVAFVATSAMAMAAFLAGAITLGR